MSEDSFFQRLANPPCFFIAEAGVNHNGDMKIALQLIDAAVEAGADAVKFQSFRPSLVVSSNAPKAEYQIAQTDESESQLEMLEKLALSESDHEMLVAYCSRKGIQFLSTPFDVQSLNLLERFDLPAYKIPSGEITNEPFLSSVARTGKPIILSTGMSTLREVQQAVEILRNEGCSQLVVLHCVSNYPAQPEDINLSAMDTMRRELDIPVGFSDHTLGIEIALAAVARGSAVIEKHFTLDRSMSGPDHAASLQPDELQEMVAKARIIESALGTGEKLPVSSEKEVAAMARRSLFSTETIRKGETIETRHISAKRPGDGIPPNRISEVVGRPARIEIEPETKIDWGMLE